MALTQIPIELSSTPGIVDNSNATAITIDSSENVLVGKTSGPNYNAVGIDLTPLGELQVTGDSRTTATFNRQTTDGAIAEFRKDGTTVGSIGTTSGTFWIGSGDVGLVFDNATANSEQIRPYNTASGTRDAAIDLGNSTGRFKDIYLSGGAYLGGTGSANKLDDYEEGTWTPTVTGLTITVGYARYTKIGDTVTFHCGITMPTTTSTSIMAIRDLPFSSQVDGGATMSYTSASVQTESLLVQTDALFFYDTAGTARLQSNYSGRVIRVTGMYQTSA